MRVPGIDPGTAVAFEIWPTSVRGVASGVELNRADARPPPRRHISEWSNLAGISVHVMAAWCVFSR